MSEHLPECDYAGSSLPEHVVGCICERLRACEERVKVPLLAIIKAGGKAYAEGWEWGRAEALDEARNEAALAMTAIDTYLPPDEHNHVLAAIDALKEDSDD